MIAAYLNIYMTIVTVPLTFYTAYAIGKEKESGVRNLLR